MILDAEEIVKVSQLHTDSTLKVSTRINGTIDLEAVVDTAAQVTILSDKIYAKLRPQPRVKKKIVLQTAGRQLKITGHVVGPLTLKLGEREYVDDVIVAAISDHMLLGLDFMRKYGVSIKLPEAHITIGDEQIPLVMDQRPVPARVSRVTVDRRTVIPPTLLDWFRATLRPMLSLCWSQISILALWYRERYILEKGSHMLVQ